MRLINKPQVTSIRVALNRVRWCPSEVPDSNDRINKDADKEVETNTAVNQHEEAQKATRLTDTSFESSDFDSESDGGPTHHAEEDSDGEGLVTEEETIDESPQ